MKTKKQIKLCHFMLLDGTTKEVERFAEVLGPLKEKINNSLDYDIEFLITNQDVRLMDIKHMLDYLTELYEKYKDIRLDKIKELYSSERKDDTTENGDKK